VFAMMVRESGDALGGRLNRGEIATRKPHKSIRCNSPFLAFLSGGVIIVHDGLHSLFDALPTESEAEGEVSKCLPAFTQKLLRRLTSCHGYESAHLPPGFADGNR